MVREIGWYEAPIGTVTCMDVAVTLDTVALTCPKRTKLFAGSRLKLVPVMVTEVPTGPVAGENPVIVGAGVITWKLLGLVPV